MIMNQTKLIVRFGVALLLLAGPFCATAAAAPSKADAEQTPGRTVTVRGVVYDDQGQPLPGASVMVKGTTQGTVTDLDGRYTLNVRPDQTLVVSFIGMKDQEIPVNGRASINAAMEDAATTLDDVVVIGYGAVKKANLTGAVDVVGQEMFESRPASNVDQMLIGNLPSVNVAITDGAPYRTSYGYNIRGDFHQISNIKLPNDFATLTLIDGVEGDPNLINPNDIESITVLKDAAATAIYGGRGAYGVILITTKNPTKKDEVRITYSSNFNYMTPRAMPELMTDGQKYAQIIADGKVHYRKTENNTANIQIASGKAQDVADEYIENAGVTTTTKAGQYRYHGHTNWLDEIFRSHANSQIHNLSVNGSSGNTNYLISGRLYDYDGIYKGAGDTYNTYNIRSKVSTQVLPWLRITENMDFTYDKVDMAVTTTQGRSVTAPLATLYTYGAPTWEVYNPDGTFSKAGAIVLGGLIGDNAERTRKNKVTKNFGTQTQAVASFFNNTLRFTADYSYRFKRNDIQHVFASTIYSENEGVTRHLDTDANLYRQGVQYQYKENNYQTINAWGEYENTFNKLWLKLMAGYNYDQRSYAYGQLRKRGLSYDTAIARNPWAFATGEKGDGLIDDNSYEEKYWRMGGFFGRINLGWDDRYLLELNARYDGSSAFAPGHQWGFFPSASAAWRVSQEHWWHINPWVISALKFRVSYGWAGDTIAASAYAFEETFETKSEEGRVLNGQTSTPYLVYPSEVFSSYTWSTVKKFDAGVDASFINNRLDVSFDYFINRNVNMLTPAQSHSDVYGSDSGMMNCADMSTYGWEASIAYNDRFMLAGKPFHSGFHGAIGHNHTIVDKYYGNEGGDIYGFYPGQELGLVWGFKSNGLFQNQEQIDNAFGTGKPYARIDDLKQNNQGINAMPGEIWLLDLDGNGQVDYGSQSLLIDEETGLPKYGDLVVLGNKKPLLQFSFGFDFDWNNWFLSLGFQGRYKQTWTPGGKHMMWAAGNQVAYGPMTQFYADNYWTPERPDAFYPVPSVGNQIIANHKNTWSQYGAKFPVDRYTFDIGYINLQMLQFGYNLPKKLIQKINVENAKIFFSGENLWNWSPLYKKIGRDFDVTTINYGGDDYEWGIDWWGTDGGYQYPSFRTFSLGLNITFGGRTKSAAPVVSGISAAALAAANAAADAANAAAAKAQAEADALRAELAKALKAKDDCEAAKDVKPMAVRRAEALHLEDIFFEINQSVIRDSEAYKVDNLVKVLKANPTAKVSITGYADQGTGTEQRNYVLTKERAEVVAEALKAAGIGPDRISTEYYGTEKDSSWTPENNRLAVCIVNN